MNLKQLRYLCGIADHELNISKAAESLHTSQPGVTRQIRQLEEELKAELLVRRGNRISALTEAGRAVVEIARRTLRDIENIRSVGAEYADANRGTLSVATTHVHARYILMPVAQRFRQHFSNVRLSIRQGNPDQIIQLVTAGGADLGLASAPTEEAPALVRLPCYRFRRCVLVPKRHPLLKKRRITLVDMAAYPMINLDASFASGVSVMSTFQANGITPNVVLTATDAEVIKAYVAAGLGIATLPEIAFDPKQDAALATIKARHLFPPNISYVWVHRHLYLRGYAFEFIRMLSATWTRAMIDRFMRSDETADVALAIDPGYRLVDTTRRHMRRGSFTTSDSQT
jgi:LysR family transcriptional regulator, cys regulon transcriptional activator